MNLTERAERIHKVYCGCRKEVSCGMAEHIVDKHRGQSGWTREASIADIEQALDEARKEGTLAGKMRFANESNHASRRGVKCYS